MNTELTLTLLIFVSGSLTQRSCEVNVRLKQSLLNDGFHRNLTYGMVFHVSLETGGASQESWYSNCMVGLEQELPPGVYVNPDELRDLRRAGRLNAFPRSKVNVELSAEHSKPSFVYIIGKLSGDRAELWLPVHARYHKAQEHGGSVCNMIAEPRLFVQCADDRLDSCKLPAPAEPPFLCNGSSKQKCGWKEIFHKMLTDAIRWDVPVGDMSHLTAVTVGTALVVLLGSLYLLRTMHKYNCDGYKKIV